MALCSGCGGSGHRCNFACESPLERRSVVGYIGEDSPVVWLVKVAEAMQHFGTAVEKYGDASNIDASKQYIISAEFKLIAVPKDAY